MLIVLAPLAKLQKELNEVSFLSVILQTLNGKSVHLDYDSVSFLPNSWNQSKVFRSSFCQREKYGIITS